MGHTNAHFLGEPGDHRDHSLARRIGESLDFGANLRVEDSLTLTVREHMEIVVLPTEEVRVGAYTFTRKDVAHLFGLNEFTGFPSSRCAIAQGVQLAAACAVADMSTAGRYWSKNAVWAGVR